MRPHKRDIPSGAAITAVALLLITSFVSGREPPPAAAPAEVWSPPADSPEVERLKLAPKLEKSAPHAPPVKRVLEASLILAKAEPASAPSSPSRAAPQPRVGSQVHAAAAPALPFSYLGKMVDGDKTTVFVARGEEHYSLAPGLVIDETYKVERVTDTAVTFVFLPRGTRQVLAVPALD